MNYSTAIFLVNDKARAVRVSYDPDVPKNNASNKFFKTFLPAEELEKGDYVVVPTNTRHGFTVGKVEEIDFRVRIDSNETFDWIVGKVDKKTYDYLVDQEKKVIDRVADAEENKKRAELKASLGLGSVELTDMQMMLQRPGNPQAASPYGQIAPPPAPQPVPSSTFDDNQITPKPTQHDAYGKRDFDDEIPF